MLRQIIKKSDILTYDVENVKVRIGVFEKHKQPYLKLVVSKINQGNATIHQHLFHHTNVPSPTKFYFTTPSPPNSMPSSDSPTSLSSTFKTCEEIRKLIMEL